MRYVCPHCLRQTDDWVQYQMDRRICDAIVAAAGRKPPMKNVTPQGSGAPVAQPAAVGDTEARTPRALGANGPIQQLLAGSIPGSARVVPGPNTEEK